MKPKRPAYVLTVARIILSVLLPLTKPFSPLCTILYVMCGLTDVFDGVVARATHTANESGARLDSIADIVFAAFAVITFLPAIRLSSSIWMIIGIVVTLKAASLTASVVKFKRPVILHTYLNKLTGLMLIAAPLIWNIVDNSILSNVVCGVAAVAAAEELLITIVSQYPRPDRTAFLQKRHIRYVIYGRSLQRAIAAHEKKTAVMGVSGINYVGHLSEDTALSQGCRLIKQSLEQSGVKLYVTDYRAFNGMAMLRRLPIIGRDRAVKRPYSINLLQVELAELPEVTARLGRRFWEGRYTIGYWIWEQTTIPDDYMSFLRLTDEIWTPSEYASQAVRAVTDQPVYTVPYAVSVEPDESRNRAYFGLPEDELLYMISYDGRGAYERKNPMAAARAFAEAFPEGSERVGMIIKATNADTFELSELKTALGVGKHVYCFTGEMDKTEYDSLLNCADVYISLHRAESFGLAMAEAMLMGKAVVATDWSANTEFMDDSCACMVSAEMVTLKHSCPPYHKGSQWAEPDEHIAALKLRRLYTDSEYRQAIANSARKRAQERFDSARTEKAIRQRIGELTERVT